MVPRVDSGLSGPASIYQSELTLILLSDEVRALGRLLNIPAHLVGRHPFPGPGLAIRILGEVTREQIKILQHADDIYIEEVRAAGLYDQISQAFVALLPVKAVGVMGDSRTYDQVSSANPAARIGVGPSRIAGKVKQRADADPGRCAAGSADRGLYDGGLVRDTDAV